MALSDECHPLARMAQGLKLDYPKLGVLVDTVQQRIIPYDFFRTLTTHVVPFIRKDKTFKRLVSRWKRQIRAYQKEQKRIKKEAIAEVTYGINFLAELLDNNEYLKTPEVKEKLENAKRYLDGSVPNYIPSYFELAADSLARCLSTFNSTWSLCSYR